MIKHLLIMLRGAQEVPSRKWIQQVLFRSDDIAIDSLSSILGDSLKGSKQRVKIFGTRSFTKGIPKGYILDPCSSKSTTTACFILKKTILISVIQ